MSKVEPTDEQRSACHTSGLALALLIELPAIDDRTVARARELAQVAHEVLPGHYGCYPEVKEVFEARMMSAADLIESARELAEDDGNTFALLAIASAALAE